MQEIKGMAPTPDQMNRLIAAREAKPEPEIITKKKKKGRGSPQGTTFVSDSPPTGVRSEVSQILHGTHWEYQKRILDMAQIVCEPSKWPIVRNIMMDIMTEQVEATRILVGQRIIDHLAEQEEKEILNNGHVENAGS